MTEVIVSIIIQSYIPSVFWGEPRSHVNKLGEVDVEGMSQGWLPYVALFSSKEMLIQSKRVWFLISDYILIFLRLDRTYLGVDSILREENRFSQWQDSKKN